MFAPRFSHRPQAVERFSQRARKWVADIWRLATRASLGAVTLVVPPLAHAQSGATIALRSEDRFRGRPVSAEQPVLRVDITHDEPHGIYFGASGTLVAKADGRVKILGTLAYLGYATALTPRLSADVGIIDRYYTKDFSGAFATNFVELYAGLSTRGVSARAFLSPNYYGTGRKTLYLEANGNIPLTRKLSLDGHVGLLTPLSSLPQSRYARGQYDMRVGISRRVGAGDVQLSWELAGPAPDFFGSRPRGRGAFILSTSYGF